MILIHPTKNTRDGRQNHVADIITEGGKFTWRCLCGPLDRHDHDWMARSIEERLMGRDAILKDYRLGLDLEEHRVGVMKYVITGFQINMRGTNQFKTVVNWKEWPLDDPENGLGKCLMYDAEHPMGLPDATEILRRIGEIVVEDGTARVHMLRAGLNAQN